MSSNSPVQKPDPAVFESPLPAPKSTHVPLESQILDQVSSSALQGSRTSDRESRLASQESHTLDNEPHPGLQDCQAVARSSSRDRPGEADGSEDPDLCKQSHPDKENESEELDLRRQNQDRSVGELEEDEEDGAWQQAEEHEVVVIGGGVSGLSAASRLIQLGVHDVCVLEARGRLGGRVVAIDIDGEKLQLGAMWIHGVLGNPMHELAVQHGLVPRLPEPEQALHTTMASRPDGSRVPFPVVQEVFEAYSVFLGRCCEYYLSGSEPPCGIVSVGHHLNVEIDIYLSRLPAREREIRQHLFQLLLDREAAISGCRDMYEVDLATFGSYCELPGGNVIPRGGCSALLPAVRGALSDERVHLNCVVRRVTVRPGRVLVLCSDGRRVRARHVVCTLPLGVLQRQLADMVRPGVSQQRMDAMHRLGFGTVNKIWLLYDRPPLPAGVTELLLPRPLDPLPTDTPMAERWHRRIFSFTRMSETVLVAWLVGDEAEFAESLPAHQVAAVCTRLLSQHLNDPSVPRPRHTVCTSWYSQPFSRGSYTFLRVGSTPEDVETISEPIFDPELPDIPRVLFAGEHCHPSFYSTVHGAYLSGRQCAETIVATARPTSESRDSHKQSEDVSRQLDSWLHGISLE